MHRSWDVGVKLRVHVSPGSKKSGVQGYDIWKKALIIKLKSPPEGGKANGELIEILSEFFSAEVEIVTGHKSRSKMVVVKGLSESEVYDRARKA